MTTNIGDTIRVIRPAPDFCIDKNGTPDYTIGDTAVIGSIRHAAGQPLYTVRWTSNLGNAYEPTRCDALTADEFEVTSEYCPLCGERVDLNKQHRC